MNVWCINRVDNKGQTVHREKVRVLTDKSQSNQCKLICSTINIWETVLRISSLHLLSLGSAIKI